MDKTYQLLKTIQKCPSLYLGKPSLERLYFYVSGYKHFQEEITPRYHDCLTGFQQYIEERFDIYTDHNWANIIQFFSESEDEAFKTFYVYLDQFLKITGEN